MILLIIQEVSFTATSRNSLCSIIITSYTTIICTLMLSLYYCSLNIGPKVTIGDLQLLKYKDKDGKVERLRIIDRVSYKWKSITDRLSNNPSKAHSVSLQCNNDPAACLRELFLDCFINNKPANDYSQDWSGIIELLDDIEEEQLAIEVRNMIAKCFNIKFS